jgi:hypothetical protein
MIGKEKQSIPQFNIKTNTANTINNNNSINKV